MSRGRIVVGGAVAQKPGAAGHAWQFLQYLLGLRRLGYEVLLLDRLDAAPARLTTGVEWVRRVLGAAGLDDCFSIDLGDGRQAGLPRARALDFVASADMLINVMGFVTDPDVLAAARRRVFLDTDPGFGQMWRALGLADVMAGHDTFVTIAERIGAPDCTVPDCGLHWITTPQPVVLAAWPAQAPRPADRLTSVASWRGAYGPIEYRDHTYGLRVHQFRRFAGLPRAAGGDFELALGIDPADARDAELLRAGGWRLADPARVAATSGGYRSYIQRSGGELMIAKGMYVDSRSGWLSERSLCYLASGRPVVAQDTGFAELYPTGAGLLAFASPDEAAEAVREVRRAPLRHAIAARALAEEHFASDRVLTRLLDAVGAAAT
jgi:hypothetical protein